MHLRRLPVWMLAVAAAIVGAAVVAVIAVVVTRDDHGRRPDYEVQPAEPDAMWGYDLEWSADGSNLYVTGGSGIAVLSGDPLAVTDEIAFERTNVEVTWNVDRSVVALSSSDPGVELWDVATGEQLPSIDTDSMAVPAWAPDGERIAVAGAPGEVVTFDARSGDELERLQVSERAFQVLDIAWPTDDRLVVVLVDGVTTIDPATGESAWSRAGEPDWMAVGSAEAGAVVDGEGRVLNLADGDQIARIDTVSSNVLAINWSPDGEWVVVSADDDQPQLWEAAAAATRRGYTELGPYDAGASWAPDSRRAVIADRYDRRLVIVDVDVDDEIELSIAGDATIARAAWSPAGDRIAAVGGDDTLWVWEISPED